MFTFSLEGTCPGCGKQLDKIGSVKANCHDCFVNDHGTLAESDDTDLCLSDYDTVVICAYCNEPLDVALNEE